MRIWKPCGYCRKTTIAIEYCSDKCREADEKEHEEFLERKREAESKRYGGVSEAFEFPDCDVD